MGKNFGFYSMAAPTIGPVETCLRARRMGHARCPEELLPDASYSVRLISDRQGFLSNSEIQTHLNERVVNLMTF